MSLEDATKFYKIMKEEEELNQKVKGLSIDDLAMYATKLGFDFTREEILKIIEENAVDDEAIILISDAQCLTEFPEVTFEFPAGFQTNEKLAQELSDFARKLLEE